MSVLETDRKAWLSTLATAKSTELAKLWDAAGLAPEYQTLRTPEIGSVMVRGRAGATGSAFNLGEMTVTRASIRLTGGEVGHGYVQGRDKSHALKAALIDAMMQTHDAPHVRDSILTPLETGAVARKTERAEKAAATQVDFFTLVRGETDE